MSETPENQQPSEEPQTGNSTTQPENGAAKKRRHTSPFLLFFPTILATAMFLIETVVCKFFVFLIGNTMGITEEGKDLVWKNFGSGTMPAILILLVLPHVVNLLRKNQVITLSDSTLKWIARGIIIGAIFFIIASIVSAASTIDETSALKFSRAITATGILIWLGMAHLFSNLFIKKLKEEIGL